MSRQLNDLERFREEKNGEDGPAESPVLSAVPVSEIQAISQRIQERLERINDIGQVIQERRAEALALRTEVVKELRYVRDNARKLLPKGRTFTQFIEEDLKISKGHVYEQMQAYELCVKHQKAHLFERTDLKVLIFIARLDVSDSDRKKLLNSAPNLSREDFSELRARYGKKKLSSYSSALSGYKPHELLNALGDSVSRVRSADKKKKLKAGLQALIEQL